MDQLGLFCDEEATCLIILSMIHDSQLCKLVIIVCILRYKILLLANILFPALMCIASKVFEYQQKLKYCINIIFIFILLCQPPRQPVLLRPHAQQEVFLAAQVHGPRPRLPPPPPRAQPGQAPPPLR